MKSHLHSGTSRSFLLPSLWLSAIAATACLGDGAPAVRIAPQEPDQKLMGNRFLTFNTVVRVRQIEVTRNTAHGPDESSVHTPAEARTFREAIEKAWPGARITWAFSWLALHDERDGYRELRDLVVSYQKKFGDEITFIPGAYFSNMYNTRYDLPAQEPADPEPGGHSRNWSLMNRINQKGIRPQDQPIALTELTADEQALIRRSYPELFASDAKADNSKKIIPP